MRAAAETLLGLVLAAVPVALWVSWSQALFFGVLVVAVACALLLVVLARDPGQESGEVRLPDEFVAELHRVFPPVYHNARKVTGRFRRTMERLRELTPGASPDGSPPPS